jgi:hypothetical protein
MRATPSVLTALLAISLVNCQEQRPVEGGSTARDSAGISIVDNAGPAWSARDRWRLSETPQTTIGVMGGDPAYELFRPRAAFRMSDGRIVIANTGTLQVRFYDASGNHLMDVGGRGGGPGEFGRLDRVFRIEDDSVVVYDQTQRRITVFDPSGTHIRDVSLDQRARNFFPIISGRFADGSYIGSLRLRRENDELPNGVVRDSILILKFSGAGELLDTLGVVHNRVMDVQTRSIGERSLRGPAEVAFSPRAVWTITGDRLFVGTSGRYEIRVYRDDGVLEGIVRRYHVPQPVTEGDRQRLVQAWRDIWYDRLDNPEIQYVLRSLEESPLPEAFPAFDPQVLDDRGRRIGESLLIDSERNLWVAEYRPPGNDLPRWSVFDADGEWLGEFTLPERFTLTDVGSDYLLGVWSDELDVESVRLYNLIKPGATDRSRAF